MKKKLFSIALLTTLVTLFCGLAFHLWPESAEAAIKRCYNQAADEFLGYNVTQQDNTLDELQPKIVLDVPTICEVGELVRIDLRDSTVVTTLLVVTIPGLETTEDFEIIEDGRRALFSSRVPGEYVVIVAGAKGDEPFLSYQRISVEGDSHATPEMPNLSRQVSQWVRKVEPYPNRTAHGKALAVVFRTTADQAGVNVEGMLETTALANAAILAGDLNKWEVFLDGLGKELDKLADANQLQTKKQYQAIWYEIAKGIERGL